MRRVDFEVYRGAVDALVVPGYSRRLVLNLPLHVLELCESAIGYVVELCPFWLCSHARGRVWSGRIVLRRDVDELEDERSSGYDAAATRQEVSADDVLEDGRLS